MIGIVGNCTTVKVCFDRQVYVTNCHAYAAEVLLRNMHAFGQKLFTIHLPILVLYMSRILNNQPDIHNKLIL